MKPSKEDAQRPMAASFSNNYNFTFHDFSLDLRYAK